MRISSHFRKIEKPFINSIAKYFNTWFRRVWGNKREIFKKKLKATKNKWDLIAVCRMGGQEKSWDLVKNGKINQTKKRKFG